MTPCEFQRSGTIELYFYGELTPSEREAFDRHLAACGACRRALEELALIREALAARPTVSAPPGGDWSGFMSGLERAIADEGRSARPPVAVAAPKATLARRPYAAYLAMAALLTLVTMSVMFVMRSRSAPAPLPAAAGVPAGSVPGAGEGGTTAVRTSLDAGGDKAFAALSEEHFERSKLVVLGLATKDARHATSDDWTYERGLASALLIDTRMYRLAAEDRGLDSLAGVMGDLEVVLLQASFTDEDDPASLGQIQRLIDKRGLLEKMEGVSHLGALGP
jgi:anti-sigma factor RsiW